MNLCWRPLLRSLIFSTASLEFYSSVDIPTSPSIPFRAATVASVVR
jgi:hypothetical protein